MSWTPLSLPSGAVPGAVLAAAYRLDDHAVYFVVTEPATSTAPGAISLRRWDPEAPAALGSVDVLARFALGDATAGPVTPPDRAWVTLGASGDLIVTLSTGSVAVTHRFGVTLLRRLAWLGGTQRAMTIDAAPILDGERLTFASTAASLRSGATMPVLGNIDIAELSAAFTPSPQVF